MKRLFAMLFAVGLFAASCGEDVDYIPEHAADAERFWVESERGVWAHVQRYPGEGEAVVLVHGISSNHHFWDLMPGRSLALYLSERGYDVYNVDLRGHGFARRGADGKRQKVGWTVDDYGAFDVASVVEHIRKSRGLDEVHYVGHSMGGMVLAVYMALHPQPHLASAVAVASPLDFRDPDPAMQKMLKNAWIAKLFGYTPTPAGARFLVGFGYKAPFHGDEWVLNPDNYEKEAYKATMRRVVSPLSRGEVDQFGLIARSDNEFVSENGRTKYRESLGHVRVPMLFLAGRADRIVSPDRVKGFYEAVGSREKEFVVAGRENGFAGDYGHLDFGTSDHAEAEVFPRIEAWIRGHGVISEGVVSEEADADGAGEGTDALPERAEGVGEEPSPAPANGEDASGDPFDDLPEDATP
ncbi:MAG: alpha/beta hydrolase [Deltaproteobacteria bacterium]|nr:MAG: alpha/beta hydrolase [Deltaproteobacteria bacterium]